ncbi:hypothetical protein [Streptomyces sp. NPDC101455]|uniref:hypothetical protein n=1 Tax=Streptomyces sp. NPDC101455 TaxID=3366142 RepID=UPI003809F0E1
MTQPVSPGSAEPDPLRIANQQEYRKALADLRPFRGIKSLNQLDQASDALGRRLPPATVSNTLTRDALPEWDFVCDYLTACGLSDTEQEPWKPAWDAVREGTAPVQKDPNPAPDSAADGTAPVQPARGASWRQKTTQRLEKAGRGLMRRKWLVLGVVLAVVATGAVTGTVYAGSHCWTLSSGLASSSGECTGVTDGSDGEDVFGAGLAPVMKAVNAENSDAADSSDTVTLALLTPLTSHDSGKDLTLQQYIGEAEGAYTAVERANEQEAGPRIRLLLANMGSGEQKWRDTVDQLKTEKDLVGVVGLGLSQQESVDAARHLSKAGIPMVADLITADGFDSTGTIDHKGQIKGLVRITMPNALQLAALAARITPGRHTAALVGSSLTPNGTTDLGTKSLDHDFRTIKELNQYLGTNSPDFDFDPLGGASAIMPTISQNLCNTGTTVDLVYYAARAKYLPAFLDALRQRSCHAQKITVIAGSDAAALDPNSPAFHDAGAPITLLYANYPAPAWLASNSNRDRSLYNGFVRAFTSIHHGQRFPASDLANSYWAVLAHDAVLTAVTAIHNAAANTHGDRPNRYDVANQLYALTNDAVPGASGRFGIDRNGNRTDPPVTIHQD